MTREIGPELVARIRHVADSLEAIANCDNDSPQPFIAAYAVYVCGEYDSSYGPDAIDEAMEIAADCNGEVVPLYRTPQTHATQGEGSVLRSGALTSRETVQQEPVAWAAMLPERIATFDRKMLFGRTRTDVRLYGKALNCYVDVFPLYRSPTLTDEEREAIEAAAMGLDGKHSLDYMKRARQASTLRSLLERLA